MEIIELTSLSSPELAPYARLTEAQLRTAGGQQSGEEGGLFIAESLNVVSCAVAAGYEPCSFLSVRRHVHTVVSAFSECERAKNAPIFTADEALLEGLTGFHLSRGILACMKRRKMPSPNEVIKDASRIAVLEGVVDSTNIGAIFRSAAALGMEAVLVGSSCCDPLNRRASRVSMGTVFQVPWAVLQSKAENRLATDVDFLHDNGFAVAAMALDENSVPISDPAPRAEKKLAVLLGSEGYGLTEETIRSCDYTVKIPMYNGVDSLNVAAASAVAFYVLANRQ